MRDRSGMPPPKHWRVEFHDEFDAEFDALDQDVQNELLKNKPGYQIDINIAHLEDENVNTYCFGDVNLLKSAFNNILDNLSH